MEFGFAVGKQDDFKPALLMLDERWTIDLDLSTCGIGIGDLKFSASYYLNAVVEVGPGGECVGAKAGAGVIGFEKLNGGASAVFDGRIDVVGMAADGKQKERANRGGNQAAQNVVPRHSPVSF
jgi:hypothetical protein